MCIPTSTSVIIRCPFLLLSWARRKNMNTKSGARVGRGGVREWRCTGVASTMEDEADVVRMCNALLEFAMKTKDEKMKSKADVLRVVTRTPLYIVLCEQFLGRKLDGLERNGGTGDDALKARVRNADCVLKAMAEKLFKIDLCHISGERVVAGVWEDNKNVIELLFFLCEKKRREKTTAGHSRASGADKGATESTSSTAVASRPKMKPAVVHARSWRPSSAGRSSPSFASYIDARDRVAAAAATAKAEKDIEAPSEEEDQKVQAVQCTAAKTAMTMNNTFQNGSSSRYIRLSPFKRRGSTTKKKKTRNSSAAGSFLLLSGDQASPRANEVAKVVVVPSATATKRPEDMHGDLADDPAAPGATAALNSSIVSNSYVNANDESILSLFSFIENNLNSNNIGGLNNESTFIDPSMMLDAHANGGLSNLAQSTVVAKIMHLIKLSQEQRGHENTAGRFTPRGVPLRYERELGRLSTSSALRKRMWIKDRVTDGRVASIRGRRVRAVAARNARHSNKVEDIMRKRFIDEVDARKRYDACIDTEFTGPEPPNRLGQVFPQCNMRRTYLHTHSFSKREYRWWLADSSIHVLRACVRESVLCRLLTYIQTYTERTKYGTSRKSLFVHAGISWMRWTLRNRND